MSLSLRVVRPAALGLGLGCSIFASSALTGQQRAYKLRSDAPRGGFGQEPPSALRDAARTSARRGGLNGRVLRQISAGSISGLAVGVALGVFSKPLTLLIGLALLGVQWLESRGVRVVPYGRIQAMFKGWDVQRALTENVAFKLSFASTLTLAAFAGF